MKSAAYDRFVQSMNQHYEDLLRGSTYDVAAIHELSSEEKNEIEALLISKDYKTVNDLEALIHIGSPSAIAAIESATRNCTGCELLFAAEYLHSIGRCADYEDLICTQLTANVDAASHYACSLAAKIPSAKIERAPLVAAWKYPTENRARECMKTLMKIRGNGGEALDWRYLDNRPPFLLAPPSRTDRYRQAVKYACATIGVDWTLALSEDERHSRKRQQWIIAAALSILVMIFLWLVMSKRIEVPAKMGSL